MNAVEEEISAVQEKCIKQLVQIVAQNAKFHSNQKKANQFIAETAIKNTGNINYFLYKCKLISFFIILNKYL